MRKHGHHSFRLGFGIGLFITFAILDLSVPFNFAGVRLAGGGAVFVTVFAAMPLLTDGKRSICFRALRGKDLAAPTAGTNLNL